MTSLDTLLNALHDPEPSVRLQAIRDLSYLGDPRAAGPLVVLLQDPRKDVRRDASRAVWQLGEAGLAALIQAYLPAASLTLEALWAIRPGQTSAIRPNRITLTLLFAMLGRFIFEPSAESASYEQHLKRAFSQADWEALLDWRSVIDAADHDFFAAGLYGLVTSATGDQPVESRSRRSNKLFMVIEDDDRLAEGIIDIIDISFEDVAVLTAPSGSAGLVLAQLFSPDLIMTDVVHPGLDGYKSMRYLRANPKVSHIPFVFCSAISSLEQQEAFQASGALTHLEKPFTGEDLIELLKTTLWPPGE